MVQRNAIVWGVLGLLAAGPATAAPPDAAMEQRDLWVAKHFTPLRETVAGTSERQSEPESGLIVVANHDPVQNNARAGRPLKLGPTEYTRGLYCHATSHVVVRLPQAGQTFTAMIGVDHNEDTRNGGGSVVFFVEASGREVFRSDVMRGGGRPGVPIQVDLDGAKEFSLRVSNAGDGISCDQADWADAKVVLSDGKEVWLGDMPIIPGAGRPLQERTVFKLPFSFVYGGKVSDELLGSWKFDESVEKMDAGRTKRTQTYADPQTNLVVRCEAVEYRDFPTVEWTLHFKNAGPTDTHILESIQSLDVRLDSESAVEFLLHHFVGSPCTPQDYRPLETRLGPGAKKRISAAGGRPTNSDLPYFNLETRRGGGIVAVGWPGQWAA
ncbi:MAG: NPCBM/NEW2 domain-containing protein, partial [Sedimentisphaerales bacterium]|nr:NPCBM/NEW2 domain-containing protein [Sedimentisphaerales bacterium]